MQGTELANFPFEEAVAGCLQEGPLTDGRQVKGRGRVGSLKGLGGVRLGCKAGLNSAKKACKKRWLGWVAGADGGAGSLD
jgi:hypothetical protein